MALNEKFIYIEPLLSLGGFMEEAKLLEKRLEIVKKQKEKILAEEARILRILKQEKMRKVAV